MFKTELTYVVVRYMLNELADEAANVGIVASITDSQRVIPVFLPDPTVKSRTDARIQREFVDRFAERVRKLEHNVVDSSKVLDEIREYSSGIVRVSAPRTVLTNDVEREIDLLYKQWVTPKPSIKREFAHRDPLGGLRREASSTLVRVFREGYGSPLSRRTFQRRYQVRGLAHTSAIDLAMIERNGKKREHLFHHVLLLPNAEESFNQAAGLSCRWVDITAKNHVDRDLTAVLFKRLGQAAKGADEAAKLLKESNIGVSRIEDLPKLAARLKEQPDLALN